MQLHRILLLSLACSLLVVSGCGDDDPVATSEPSELDAYFNLNIDDAPLQLNSMIYTNEAGTTYSIKELRFIITDIQIHDDQGKSVTLKKLHYFDIDEPSTQSIHVSNLPHANYTSVSFRFGLDADDNVRDKYPAIPAIMVWPTALGPDLGYHYMQLEGNYEQSPGGPTGGYTTHTGPRHLDGTNPSYPGVVDATPHHFDFPISASFTPTHIHEGGHGELEISFNLNGWYLDHTPSDGVDTQYDFNTLPDQMIMGDLDAQGKLGTNGPGCFSATMAAHGGHDEH